MKGIDMLKYRCTHTHRTTKEEKNLLVQNVLCGKLTLVDTKYGSLMLIAAANVIKIKMRWITKILLRNI